MTVDRRLIKDTEPGTSLNPGILGANGFVATVVLKELGIVTDENLMPRSEYVDIRNADQVMRWVSGIASPTIINFAAYTNVNQAEEQRNRRDGDAWTVNGEGVRNLAVAAKAHNKLLVHISTDFVFPGSASDKGPYVEDHKVGGSAELFGWYAWTKIEGENAIREINPRHAIIRISYPFFGDPGNPKDFATSAASYTSLFSDQLFTPTYIPDLADALNVINERQIEGVFHVATNPITTPYEFGSYIAEKLGNQKPSKGSLVEFLKDTSRARKPVYGGLSCETTQRALGLRFHTWQEAIDLMYPTRG